MKRTTLALVLMLAATGAGCIRTTGPESIRRDMTAESGVELHKDFGLTVTRSGMWLARTGMKFSDEDDISLEGVKRLEVGVYSVVQPEEGAERARRLDPPSLAGWENLVSVREYGGAVFVMTRSAKNRVRGLLVVVAEDDEWVVVKLKGKLDQMLTEAMELAFDEAERPDLFAKARRELERAGTDGGRARPIADARSTDLPPG